LPDQPGAHQQLQADQLAFVAAHMSVYSDMAALYFDGLSVHQDVITEIEEHYLDPHEKKLLREHAWNELKESCDAFNPSEWLKGRVRAKTHAAWKMKPEEYGKPGKKPRTIVDLGVSASLLGFRLAEYLKQEQANKPFEYKGGHFVFCKSPERNTLKKLFALLHQPPGRFFFLYFSDDACLSYLLVG